MIAAETFEPALATPLDSLNVPTRLANVLARRGIRSIGELVRLAPEELLVEKNLGRKSVADARALIEAAVGVRWEDARSLLRRRAAGLAPVDPAPVEEPEAGANVRVQRWARFRVTLAPLASTRLRDLELPTRLYTFAGARGVETLGELVAIPWDELASAKNVGRGTLAATLAVLEATSKRPGAAAPAEVATEATSEPAPASAPLTQLHELPDGARWLTLLRRALATFDGQERIIATQRAGLAGPIPTLQELGECFGVSRERIRQLEVRAIERLRKRLPRAEAADRIVAACDALVTPALAAAERDPFLAFEPMEVDALVFFVNDLVAEGAHALVLGDDLVLSRVDRAALAKLLKGATAAVETATFPIEEDELVHTIAARLEVGEADARRLLSFVTIPLQRAGTRLLGLGRTREAEILAALRAADGPVPRALLEERYGSIKYPAEMVFVDHGLVSLSEKIAGWDRWARRLPPLVRSLIEREGPERQWSTPELVELLAPECELPEWMNGWTLGSILRRSSEVEYLGRNIVTLPHRPPLGASGAPGDEVEARRVHVVPALEAILRAHGGPMSEDAAKEALAALRSISANTWNLMRMRRPFLLLDGGRIGLYPRDVPGGEARVAPVLAALYEWLVAEQSGLPGAEVARFLEELGSVAGGLSPRVFRSVARLDGRFRLSVSGAIGLAEWESVRVPTHAETLEALLEEGAGAVSVAAVRARILTSAGEPLTRPSLVNLAGAIGARVEGDMVLRRGGADRPRSALEARALAELPERTAAVFDRLLDQVRADAAPPRPAALEQELAQWGAVLRAHAASDAPHIELDQVATIVTEARALVARCADLDDEPRALAVAAVRYVLCTDDADSDLAVGGLDDDEAVLTCVRAALERVEAKRERATGV